MATVLTNKGRDILTARLKGSGTEPLNIGWGLNPNALTAAVWDVSLFSESTESRVAGTSTQQTTGSNANNDTYQVVGTIVAAGSRAITEAALFDSTTKPTTNTVAAGGVVGSAVSTTLNTGSTFSPGNGNYIQIRNEIMQVTAGSGSTALTVVRGAFGSTAISSIAVSDIVNPGNPPGQTGIAAGNCFLHGDFAVINLVTSDSIQFTVKVQFT